MPWNGLGVFNRLHSWVADAAAGIAIEPSRIDADSNDIALGFSNVLTRDGQGKPTANLPMATFRHTGVGNGVARTDYAAMGQVQDGNSRINWAVAGGTVNAITATLSPAPTSLRDGMLLYLRALGANTGAVTLQVNGLGANSVERYGRLAGQPNLNALQIGDIPAAGAELVLRYKGGGNPVWQLLNPALPDAVRATLFNQNYTVNNNQNNQIDTIIAYAALNFPFTVNLIAAAAFPTAKRLTIVDETGSANSNNITVSANGGDTINGASTYTINTNYGSVTLESDGSSKWTVTAKT